nr:unnamed protein product [Callosobruchus analis]
MSKRSYNSDLEKEDHVIKRQRKKEKFDKLQREMETLQRKIDLFSSDSSSAEEGDGIRTTTIADVHVEADSLNLVINENEPIIKPALSEITDTLNIGAETTSEEPRDGPTDILRLFGLENIVKSGINHEEKQKIIEKYPPAANCTLLVPPILNEEIAGALTDNKVKEDRYLQKLQSQIAAGLMALYQPILFFMSEGQQNQQRKTRGKARSFTEFDKIEVCRDSVPSKSEQEALPKTSPTEGQEISAIEVSENHEKVLLTQSTVTLPWLWHIYQDGFSKEKHTRGSHTHTFSFSVGEDYETI